MTKSPHFKFIIELYIILLHELSVTMRLTTGPDHVLQYRFLSNETCFERPTTTSAGAQEFLLQESGSGRKVLNKKMFYGRP